MPDLASDLNGSVDGERGSTQSRAQRDRSACEFVREACFSDQFRVEPRPFHDAGFALRVLAASIDTRFRPNYTTVSFLAPESPGSKQAFGAGGG
jgi:hypothetical protein